MLDSRRHLWRAICVTGMCAVAGMFVSCARSPADQPKSWLDRPLVNWNVAPPAMAMAPPPEESREDLVDRCRLTPLESTAGERAVTAAGWLPFLPNGEAKAREGVEIVGGMASADGMCRPSSYNLFVFVADRFAGTLSPVVMTSRLDGAAGMVEMAPDTIAVEFVRYTEKDPLCCPSSRTTIHYRLDRTVPLVIPTTREPATK